MAAAMAGIPAFDGRPADPMLDLIPPAPCSIPQRPAEQPRRPLRRRKPQRPAFTHQACFLLHLIS